METLVEKVQFLFVTNCGLGLVGTLSLDSNSQEGTYQVNKSECYLEERLFDTLKMNS